MAEPGKVQSTSQATKNSAIPTTSQKEVSVIDVTQKGISRKVVEALLKISKNITFGNATLRDLVNATLPKIKHKLTKKDEASVLAAVLEETLSNSPNLLTKFNSLTDLDLNDLKLIATKTAINLLEVFKPNGLKDLKEKYLGKAVARAKTAVNKVLNKIDYSNATELIKSIKWYGKLVTQLKFAGKLIPEIRDLIAKIVSELKVTGAM